MEIVLKKVLVPIDFSENSAAAIRYACALCEAFGLPGADDSSAGA